MNELTRHFLNNALLEQKEMLASKEKLIEYKRSELSLIEKERDILIAEIKALEEDLNK